MPIKRLKEIPRSRWTSANKSFATSTPEFKAVMEAVRLGLNGECIEITFGDRELESAPRSVKHPVQAFVHALASAIKAEKLGYAVRQRQVPGEKYPRAYVIAYDVESQLDEGRRDKRVSPATK